MGNVPLRTKPSPQRTGNVDDASQKPAVRGQPLGAPSTLPDDGFKTVPGNPYQRVESDAWERRAFAAAENRKLWAANRDEPGSTRTGGARSGGGVVNPAAGDIDGQLAARYSEGTLAAWSAVSRVMQRDLAASDMGEVDPIETADERERTGGFGAYGRANQGQTWASLQESELWGEGGPTAADVVQGNGGTCYFLSCLAAAVTENPEFIRDGIRPHDPPHDAEGNRLWDVRLFVPDEYGNARPVTVTINEDVLRNSQTRNEISARSVDSDQDGKWEMWVVLYEKAYAALNSPDATVGSGYDAINQGGWGNEAYFALTGRGMNTAWLDFAGLNDNEILGKLSKANPEHGDVVMVGSRAVDVPAGQRSDQYETQPGSGIGAGHMYQVLGVIYPGDPGYHDAVQKRLAAGGHVADGEPLVILRNPWGRFEPGSADANGNSITPPDGKDDGIFCIGYYELHDHFDYLADGTNGEPENLGWETDESYGADDRLRAQSSFDVGSYMTQNQPLRG